MAFNALVIGSGFGARFVKGAYEGAGMEVDVVTARDGAAIREAVARPYDLVSVHSPPFLHAEHVNVALDHGRNVLCDKPFGTSASQAAQMLDRAREAGVIHLLNFEFRCDPARARVKELIDAGAIGKVTHVHGRFFNAICRVPLRPHGWQFDKTMGGGWVRIHGTHMIDALRWWVADVIEADARGRTEVKERPDKGGLIHPSTAEDAFTALLTLEGGASAVIDTAWAMPATLPECWTIAGTEGVIDMVESLPMAPAPVATELRILSGGETRVEHIGPFPDEPGIPALRRYAKKVRAAVEGREQIEPSFEAGLAVSKVVDRLLNAIESGAPGT